ncbi:MAG: DUF5060 domain-containing protein [Chitinophagaceae bacterium]|nr:DUF5060 domain-containing protein [Chitinophagaceae bacterium]
MNKRVKHIMVLNIFLLAVSAFTFAQQQVQQWDRFELTLKHNYSGNAFINVKLTATFNHNDTSYTVDGFYDGENTFRIRFMPERTGTWQYTTKSNVKQLNNQKGSFECVAASGNNHGIVRVSNTYNFKYADGRQYYPVGTTAYVWNHMSKGVQALTLESLKKSGFNKVRMCVFPKDYNLVKEEPEIYPFNPPGTEKGPKGVERKTWDFTTFNTEFFRILEKQIDELKQLGIEADLILFHPYDKGRWGFDSLTMETNFRYIKYITARLSSFRNVWWSMANEFDYVKYKTVDDWIALSKAVKDTDPYRHLLSIHGSSGMYFKYWLPEFTHVSIQDEGPVLNWGAAVLLRNAYYKPIIYDEVGYEGNLTNRWGRYSPEEMTYVMWMGIIGGTYVTHGESYMFKDATDTIFWAKGGQFKGSSWKRAGFLRKILEEAPGPFEPADGARDFKTATTGKGQYIVYFGKEMNEFWTFNLPQKNALFERLAGGKKYKVEIIDTWDMTITPVAGVFETSSVSDYRLFDKDMKKIRLPMKPYITLRITEIKK